jgi:hypothetical protein
MTTVPGTYVLGNDCRSDMLQYRFWAGALPGTLRRDPVGARCAMIRSRKSELVCTPIPVELVQMSGTAYL